jgi:hypothetical protein
MKRLGLWLLCRIETRHHRNALRYAARHRAPITITTIEKETAA